MATVLALSLAGSPGVTTTALALTLEWSRSALLIEADSSRYSAVLPGYLRGQIAHSHGIGELAVLSNNSGSLDINQVWGQTISLVEEGGDGPERRLLPGFKSTVAPRSMTGVWGQLGQAAAGFEGMAMDVLFDAGRWAVGDPRAALLRLADVVVIVARPTLADIVAVHERLPALRLEVATAGNEQSIVLVLVETAAGPQLSNGEIQKVLGIARIARVPWDPRTASLFSAGESLAKRVEKTPFGRALPAAAEQIRAVIAEQRGRLDHDELASDRGAGAEGIR